MRNLISRLFAAATALSFMSVRQGGVTTAQAVVELELTESTVNRAFARVRGRYVERVGPGHYVATDVWRDAYDRFVSFPDENDQESDPAGFLQMVDLSVFILMYAGYVREPFTVADVLRAGRLAGRGHLPPKSCYRTAAAFVNAGVLSTTVVESRHRVGVATHFYQITNRGRDALFELGSPDVNQTKAAPPAGTPDAASCALPFELTTAYNGPGS